MLVNGAAAIRAKAAVAQFSKQSRRLAHDVAITGQAQRPVISYGPPGRSAVTGHVATVFGCTGFLGRYLVARLAKAGTQVIIPYREEDMKRHLKVTGDLGQVVPMEWDLRNDHDIQECVRHSDIVYNLVGRDYETKNFDFSAVNVHGAERIAKAAKAAGVPRFVHVSHLNASPQSTSAFYRTKAEGESVVRAAFPNATIIRPGPIYGHEDRLLRSMAVWPSTWKLNQGRSKLTPCHVIDVATALSNLISLPPTARTLSLPGPRTYSVEDMLELISAVTYNPMSRAPQLPKAVAKLICRVSGFVWWPVLSPDQVERRFIDDVEGEGDWGVLGVVPDELEQHALTYLQMYRSSTNFVRPLVIPERGSNSETTYRVIQ